jgi:glycosyltransferase involved in cell wall biosynthesis
MNHVAMLIPTIDQIGGAERQVLELSKALAAKGWRVTLIALSGHGGTAAQELSDAGVAYLSLGMRKAWVDPRGWLRYLRWARLHRPDILHAHLPHATYFARWTRPLHPVPVVIDTIHTSSTGSAGRQRGYRLSGRLSNWTTCVSQPVADAAIAARMISSKATSVIPNGVDLSAEPKTVAQRTDFRWIAVGRLARVKDYPTLLRALAQLPSLGNMTPAQLEIVGSGPEEQTLRALAAELGITDRVRFAGFQSDVRPFLANADAFVLSSLWEGLPVSVLEAAASGLPVVATNGAGSREAMIPHRTGLLVPVGDATALAEAMREVMALSHDQRSQMGARGRQFIEKYYALPNIVSRWEDLYRQLLDKHPHARRRA